MENTLSTVSQLKGMFPSIESDTIRMIFHENRKNMDKTIDVLILLSSEPKPQPQQETTATISTSPTFSTSPMSIIPTVSTSPTTSIVPIITTETSVQIGPKEDVLNDELVALALHNQINKGPGPGNTDLLREEQISKDELLAVALQFSGGGLKVIQKKQEKSEKKRGQR